ncbi:MAG: hypothetical protein J2P28_26250, partial [Actinobacteria bacterium]|nr:hypothetical protein [Actinomycetota bacterium]
DTPAVGADTPAAGADTPAVGADTATVPILAANTGGTAAPMAGSAAAAMTRQDEIQLGIEADQRLTQRTFPDAVLIGAAQILALLAGISRDGVTMVAGMFAGLSREDAARFAFLLATPVIFAAGVLKIPDLWQYGRGDYGPILVGSIVSGIGAYLSVRFLVRYFRTSTLTPFAIYCLVVGLGSILYLQLR